MKNLLLLLVLMTLVFADPEQPELSDEKIKQVYTDINYCLLMNKISDKFKSFIMAHPEENAFQYLEDNEGPHEPNDFHLYMSCRSVVKRYHMVIFDF